MLILSALALFAVQPDPDLNRRSPADAFIAGLEQVCPIYMKSDGLSPADEAVLGAELRFHAGPIAVLKTDDEADTIRLEGYPQACLVMIGPDTRLDAVSNQLDAWIDQSPSGWRPSSPQGEQRSWTNADGTLALVVVGRTEGEEGVMAMIQAVGAAQVTERRIDARRMATLRPTDQAMLEAVDSLCAVAQTPAWSTVDQGEITVRHAGNSRLGVRYDLNGDCTVYARGDDTDEVGAALLARMQAAGSGWTLMQHAWMAPPPNSQNHGVEANFHHSDGRDVMIVHNDGEVQAVLWTGSR